MIKIPNTPDGTDLYVTIGSPTEERSLLYPLQYYGPFEEEPGVIFIALEDAAWLTEDALQELQEWTARKWTTDQLGTLYSSRVREFPQAEKLPKRQIYKSGYIYLIQGGNYYKIGHSVNPYTRLSKLVGTLPSHKLTLVHTIKTKDMYALEYSLHEYFADKRMEGEWFELDRSDIALLKRIEYMKGALSEEDIEFIKAEGQSNE